MTLLVRTIKVNIYPDNYQKDLILQTMKEYSRATQFVFDYVLSTNVKSRVTIHHATYKNFRKISSLPSQLVINARNKAIDVRNSLIEKSRLTPVTFPSTLPIRYDNRCSKISKDRSSISFVTLQGRITLNLHFPRYCKKYIEDERWEFKSMELVSQKKKGHFFIHLVINKYVSEEDSKIQQYVGINRGVKYLAVTSTNQFYNGTRLREVRNKHFRLRRSLQKKGTRSAKRKLRHLGGKEQRFRKDMNHCISKQIVKNIKSNSVIIIEDLTGIREKAKYPKKSKTSREINSWPYFDLEQKIIYKAAEKNIEVVKWNPLFISQRCSACGYIKKDNYRSRQFSCIECEYSINADLNAARNQIHNYFSELPMVQLVYEALRFMDGALVIIPNVAS